MTWGGPPRAALLVGRQNLAQTLKFGEEENILKQVKIFYGVKFTQRLEGNGR